MAPMASAGLNVIVTVRDADGNQMMMSESQETGTPEFIDAVSRATALAEFARDAGNTGAHVSIEPEKPATAP